MSSLQKVMHKNNDIEYNEKWKQLFINMSIDK